MSSARLQPSIFAPDGAAVRTDLTLRVPCLPPKVASSNAGLGPAAAAISSNAVAAAATTVRPQAFFVPSSHLSPFGGAVVLLSCPLLTLPPPPPPPPQMPLGLVLMTQNGATVWKVVPIYISFASLSALWTTNDPSLKNIFSTPVPGILFAVNSDASGKHVFAVGSPSSQWSSVAAVMTPLVANTPAALGIQVKTTGTILYSGNSGMSWVQQTAPTLYAGLVPYTLFDVAVQKGTTAVAVGGSSSIKFGDKAAGTIIFTANGGFSWTQAVYPSSTGSTAPVFTCVSLQPSVAGIQTVWVGGFTTRSDTALTAAAVLATSFYPVAAVSGLVAGVSSGVPRSRGQIYTLLSSRDSGKTFAAAPSTSLPTGFVLTSNTMAGTDSFVTDRSVYGVTWDNANHGWVFGCARRCNPAEQSSELSAAAACFRSLIAG